MIRNQQEITGAEGAEENFWLSILQFRFLLCGVRHPPPGGGGRHLVSVPRGGGGGGTVVPWGGGGWTWRERGGGGAVRRANTHPVPHRATRRRPHRTETAPRPRLAPDVGFGLTLRTPTSKTRSAAVCRVGTSGGPVTIVGTHLDDQREDSRCPWDRPHHA